MNYVYGTFLAVRGLVATNDPRAFAAVQQASRWLASVQNKDGGWGESCSSYEVDRFVPAESTPTQTAWALLGLIASGKSASSEVRRGVQWLMERQRSDGNWDEELTTGTGFPNVFYLSYHLYRMYFPALALAIYRKCQPSQPPRVYPTPGLPHALLVSVMPSNPKKRH